jgi:hypothetical protein
MRKKNEKKKKKEIFVKKLSDGRGRERKQKLIFLCSADASKLSK